MLFFNTIYKKNINIKINKLAFYILLKLFFIFLNVIKFTIII